MVRYAHAKAVLTLVILLLALDGYVLPTMRCSYIADVELSTSCLDIAASVPCPSSFYYI